MSVIEQAQRALDNFKRLGEAIDKAKVSDGKVSVEKAVLSAVVKPAYIAFFDLLREHRTLIQKVADELENRNIAAAKEPDGQVATDAPDNFSYMHLAAQLENIHYLIHKARMAQPDDHPFVL